MAFLQDLSNETGTRTLQLLEAVARHIGLLPPLQSQPTPMPTVTKSIGTSSKDYSTITLWEADLDNAAVYSAGDDAVGECYDDSTFDEAVTINGGGTLGLASRTLTVASTERHDGTAGTGARLVATTSGRRITFGITNTAIHWLEFDGADQAHGTGLGGIDLTINAYAAVVSRLIVHRVDSDGTVDGIGVGGGAAAKSVLNCISYDNSGNGISNTTGTDGGAIRKVMNCTLHANGIYGLEDTTDNANRTVQNVIATSNSTADFQRSAPASAVYDHNAASDTTASGTGSIDSVTPSNEYVSTVGGSEDLHLKSGASSINAGVDLTTSPTFVNFDIDGRDRDAEGDTWDIGADEFVTIGGAFLAAFAVGSNILLGPLYNA